MKKYLLLLLLLGSIEFKTNAQTYSAIGTGINGIVNCLYNDTINNVLYIGGNFNMAGGISAYRIARWDGSTWYSMGTIGNNNSSVNAMCLHNGELYIGGDFSTADGITANNIAKWDGTTWQPLNTGLNGNIASLASYNGNLYVGGYFNTLGGGGFSVNNIAIWNGSNWLNLGTGINGGVTAMKVFNNAIYIGGAFNIVNGVSINGIISWDGTNWDSLGNGVESVQSLLIHNNELYVGGHFTTAGSISANHIAKWNGTNWSALGSGMYLNGVNEIVNSLGILNNELYAAGYFNMAGGVSVSNIAKWDGSSWLAIGAGINNYGYSLEQFDNSLIVGGNFTMAGGISASRIARITSSVGIDEDQNYAINTVIIYPNPFSSVATIHFNFKNSYLGSIILFYDIYGREVRKEQILQSEFEIDRGNLSAGIYTFKIEKMNECLNIGKIIIQ